MRDILKKAIDEWKKCHNPWTEKVVFDIIKQCPAGTIITADYHGIGDGTKRYFQSTTKLTKITDDRWHFTDSVSACNGDTVSDRGAVFFLDACCCYSALDRLRFEGN